MLTTSTSYVPSRSVHGTVTISVLGSKNAKAKPILDGQYYRRSDALLARAFQLVAFNDYVQPWRAFTVSPNSSTAALGLTTNPQELASYCMVSGCRASRKYEPHRDTVRYCVDCKIWIHIQCMSVTRTGGEAIWDEDVNEIWDDSGNTRVWLQVRKVALQRAPRAAPGDVGRPFTIEGVLTVLTEYLSSVARTLPGDVAPTLPDFDEKLYSVVRDLVNDSSAISLIVDEVRHAVDSVDTTMYYRCPDCGHYV